MIVDKRIDAVAPKSVPQPFRLKTASMTAAESAESSSRTACG
jgi:hypothetical protein